MQTVENSKQDIAINLNTQNIASKADKTYVDNSDTKLQTDINNTKLALQLVSQNLDSG